MRKPGSLAGLRLRRLGLPGGRIGRLRPRDLAQRGVESGLVFVAAKFAGRCDETGFVVSLPSSFRHRYRAPQKACQHLGRADLEASESVRVFHPGT